LPTRENFLQPAAARIGAPPRSKFGVVGKKLPAPRPMLLIPPTGMRAGPIRSGTYNPSRPNPHGKTHSRSACKHHLDALRSAERVCFMRARATPGSTTLNQWVPGSSPGAPATDRSQVERPLLPPFLARGSLLFPVSARRHRLQRVFLPVCLRRQKSRSKLKEGPLRGDRAATLSIRK
jgi:hypothetical protein